MIWFYTCCHRIKQKSKIQYSHYKKNQILFFKNYNNAKKVSFNLEVIESHVLVENKSHLSDGLNFATPTEKANYVINFHLNCYMDTESLNITNFDLDFIQARSTESGFSKKHQLPVLVLLKWIELGHRLNKIQNTTYGKNLWKSKCFLLKRILLLILISLFLFLLFSIALKYCFPWQTTKELYSIEKPYATLITTHKRHS